ncbi:hypothetical protein BJV77DRAFT_1063530 [Russula vinacea]|nr:hypothetical protein BJV77DRAFT_1063530 [Russula vinacea]
MDVVFLLVSLFIGNEFTVDDLGMLLVMVAVVILIMGVIYRVAHLFAWMIIPVALRDELLRRNLH